MTIGQDYAADTVGGEVAYEQVFTAICYPGLGIESEGTLVYPDEAKPPKPPKPRKAKRDESQLTLF